MNVALLTECALQLCSAATEIEPAAARAPAGHDGRSGGRLHRAAGRCLGRAGRGALAGTPGSRMRARCGTACSTTAPMRRCRWPWVALPFRSRRDARRAVAGPDARRADVARAPVRAAWRPRLVAPDAAGARGRYAAGALALARRALATLAHAEAAPVPPWQASPDGDLAAALRPRRDARRASTSAAANSSRWCSHAAAACVFERPTVAGGAAGPPGRAPPRLRALRLAPRPQDLARCHARDAGARGRPQARHPRAGRYAALGPGRRTAGLGQGPPRACQSSSTPSVAPWRR